jgi:hypothetical protein
MVGWLGRGLANGLANGREARPSPCRAGNCDVSVLIESAVLARSDFLCDRPSCRQWLHII